MKAQFPPVGIVVVAAAVLAQFQSISSINFQGLTEIAAKTVADHLRFCETVKKLVYKIVKDYFFMGQPSF